MLVPVEEKNSLKKSNDLTRTVTDPPGRKLKAIQTSYQEVFCEDTEAAEVLFERYQ